MFHTKKRLFLLTQAFIWLSVTVTALGEATTPKVTSEEFISRLQSRLKQVDNASDLNDAEKAKVKDLYNQALAEMEAGKRWTAKTTQFEEQAVGAPAELKRTKAELADLPAQPTTALPADTKQLEQRITKREADLNQWRTALAGDEAELKGRASRRAKIPEQVNAAKQRLAEITTQLQASPPSDQSSQASLALRMILLARERTAKQEIACCEKELMACVARTELLPLLHDLGVRRVALAEREIKQWQEIANRRRQREADQQVERASREAGQADPAVQGLVKENAELATTRKSLAGCIDDITRQADKVNKSLNTVTEQYKRIKEKVEAAGKTNVTNTIGLLLRKQREELPNLDECSRNIGLQQQTQREVQLTLLQLQDDRLALADLDQQTQAVLKKLKGARQGGDRAELETAIHDALKTKHEYLSAVIGDYDVYYDKLVDLINAEMKLIEETDRCAQYIDQRVLWIASAAPLAPADVAYAGDACWWLAGPNACLDIGRTLAADARRNMVLSSVAFCIFLLLFYWRMRFHARVHQIGQQAVRGSCYRFLPTLETALLTAMIAVGWPGLMYYLGWRLTAAADASELCRAVGAGLTATARVFFALELLRHTCCHCGLGESHFGWSAAALKLLRQNIRWFTLPVLPLMCVAVAMAWQGNDHRDTSLGRVCFMSALLCFALVLHRILRPASVVFQAMIAERRGGWMERLRYVWYPLCTLTPAALAVLAAVGYHYTARQLATRLILTTYVLVGGIVCRALLLRWTLVNQRKLAIEQARQRRAAAQSESHSGDEESGAADRPAAATAERDLATINIQTRRLVEYSLAVACTLAVWCAWIDVLPALGNVNMTVWRTTVSVTEEVNLPSGGKKLEFREQLREITLADLCLAAIILATTVIAAKNIPGLLEMAVLQHLPVDAGVRYAVATVSRYVITIVGILLCCGSLGVGWSKVQWLVAAMGLGLGFGLQEIFANFVSGLIILFERPVRVGDVVTIDNVTGVVSRIHMRATTITDWDRKELIIPNKEFITGRVLNWTLTDPVNRVVINVGIAYGSDTQRAAEILLKTAQNHPHVLDEPAPRVTFESFGDNALNFVLKCFLPNLENRGTVIHELHMGIDREFREAGIEIAFPQHDIHVRSINAQLPLAQPAVGGVWPPVEKAA